MTSRFHWLDLLRFLAAFAVVATHARGASLVPFAELDAADKTVLLAIFYGMTRIANEAVVVFFVLSGFLVGGRAMERIMSRSFQPAEYAIDRVVRIMLPLVPALVLTSIVTLISHGKIDLIDLTGNLFSMQGILVDTVSNNAPLWSLSYEVWFYVLAFSIGLAVTSSSRAVAPALLVIVAAIFTRLDATYLFCWLVGAYAYVFRPSRPSGLILVGGLLLSLYGVVASQFGTDSDAVLTENLQQYVVSRDVARILLSVGIAIVIQQCIQRAPRTRIAMTCDALGTRLAAASYTLYLTHYPVMKLLHHTGIVAARTNPIDSIAPFLVMLIVSFAVAYAFYWMFERHTGKVRKIVKDRCAA